MAQQHEPKKETVRITLPPTSGAKRAGNGEARDTVRINLPARPPTAKITEPTSSVKPLPSASLRPPPFPVRPPAIAATPTKTPPPLPPNLPPPPTIKGKPIPAALPPPIPASSGIYPGASVSDVHPKKETARISVVPDEPARPSVNMKKTQPLIKTPAAATHTAHVTVSANPAIPAAIESIPRPFLWALLGASALTFLIQLWNYFTV